MSCNAVVPNLMGKVIEEEREVHKDIGRAEKESDPRQENGIPERSKVRGVPSVCRAGF
jgi:hypothetical protein